MGLRPNQPGGLTTALTDVRPLVIKNEVGGGTLIRSYVKVPDELNRMVILDASFPVRSLLRLANERLAPNVPWQLRLILAREGRPCSTPSSSVMTTSRST